MCSTFAKITKLSQEERFMRLLLIQSFPRYFLSIPPQIKPSTDSSNTCEYAASTKHAAKPLTAPRGWARNTARRGEQVFPCTILLCARARVEGRGRATPQHRWKQALVPHRPLVVDQNSGAWLVTSSHETLKSLPLAMNACVGTSPDRFSSREKDPGKPASTHVRVSV